MKDEENEDEITQSMAREDLGEPTPINGQVEKLKESEQKYLRLYADFENFRKRVAKEKEDIALLTSQRHLKEILEIKDHLEMALDHAENSPATKTLKDGVGLTLKQLNKYLESVGVQEAKALGETFDPNFHEAIQQEQSVEYKAGVVVRVYQKGYLFQGKLLRAARVAVAA